MYRSVRGRVHCLPAVGALDVVQIERFNCQPATGQGPSGDNGEPAALGDRCRLEAETVSSEVAQLVFAPRAEPERFVQLRLAHPVPVVGNHHVRVGSREHGLDVHLGGVGRQTVVDQVRQCSDKVVADVAKGCRQPTRRRGHVDTRGVAAHRLGLLRWLIG